LNDLDKKLEPYIKSRRGFFVEAGANNGIRQSNTLYFEKYMGWKGLLIEPIPELAAECGMNRPRCIVENCALVSDNYSSDTVVMQYCNLMSLVKGGMKSEEEEAEHLKRGRQFLDNLEEIYEIAVPARTLTQVLDQYEVEHIDLLSLDVEGYEAEVLSGIDFDKYRPRYMLIEVRYPEDVEAVIKRWYHPVAVLTIQPNYQDVLYERL